MSINSFADSKYLNAFESKLNRTFKVSSPDIHLESNPYIMQITINKLGSVLNIEHIPSGKKSETEKYYVKSIFNASPFHPLTKHFPSADNSITIEATFQAEVNKPKVSKVILLNVE